MKIIGRIQPTDHIAIDSFINYITNNIDQITIARKSGDTEDSEILADFPIPINKFQL